MNYSVSINRKKCAALFVVLIYTLISFVCITIPAEDVLAVRTEPNRVINVVYDDSGSMYINTNRWSQALYSLEVFAAMLGDNDTMNVYYMSNYSTNSDTFDYTGDVSGYEGPSLVLHGSSGAENNVAAVHNRITQNATGTPWAAVRKAQYDLENTSADEKWLVILTDGAFEDGSIPVSDMDMYLNQKSDDISVVCLALANVSSTPTNNEANNIYVDTVSGSESILSKITDVITRVFNSNKLPNISNNSVSFGLPMSELIVFAQGADVEINGISDSNGNSYSARPVDVIHRDDSNAANYRNATTDTSLKGQLAIFRGDFNPGTYNFDVTGAQTLEVFYKPNVEIMAFLTDPVTGEEIPADSAIYPGTYTVEFVFVKAGTTEKVEDISLIEPVEYYATFDGNTEISSGDTVEIDIGNHSIHAEARFLDYNVVETDIDVVCTAEPTNTPTPTPEGSVIPVTFEVISSDDYVVSEDSVDTSEPIIVHALLDGREFTSEEWALMTEPEIELTTNARKYKLTNPQITKLDTIGDFEVTFEVNGAPADDTYDSAVFSLTYRQEIDEWTTWAGDYEGDINFSDDRSWLERYKDKLIAGIIIGLAALLILLYMPFIKHYLPKMKKYPTVEIDDRAIFKQSTSKGAVKKDILTTILPLIPQTGTINYLPSTASVPKTAPLKVKAAGGGKMIITNQSVFEQKDCPVTFSGRTLVKDDFDVDNTKKKRKSKPYYLTGGTVIEVDHTKKKITYSCCPKR